MGVGPEGGGVNGVRSRGLGDKEVVRLTQRWSAGNRTDKRTGPSGKGVLGWTDRVSDTNIRGEFIGG